MYFVITITVVTTMVVTTMRDITPITTQETNIIRCSTPSGISRCHIKELLKVLKTRSR